MQSIKIYNTHCCGEIGEVIYDGYQDIKGKTILDQSKFIFKDQRLRNFLLNEPRGGVFKHYNLIVPPKNKKAKAGFIIMEPEDNPLMSGSNSICVATVLLEKNFIEIIEPITEFYLEAPGGLIKILAECKNKKVLSVTIENILSFVDQMDVKINTSSYGEINISTVFGGDTFVICKASDFNLTIEKKNAKKFVTLAKEIIYETNNQIGFKHPFVPDLNYISFCQFIEPITINKYGIKEGKNTVCIRPGKLDRSPCGTGTSARLALMRAKNEINIDEKFISKSIIDSKFESFVKDENIYKDYKMITPSIKGSAFITGKQEMYISDLDPFPYGYKLNDTWPDS